MHISCRAFARTSSLLLLCCLAHFALITPGAVANGRRAPGTVENKPFVYLIQVQLTSEALVWLNNRSTASSDVIVLVWGEGSNGALCFDPRSSGTLHHLHFLSCHAFARFNGPTGQFINADWYSIGPGPRGILAATSCCRRQQSVRATTPTSSSWTAMQKSWKLSILDITQEILT